MAQPYRTPDLATAAFLLCRGADFKGLEPLDPRRLAFVFEPAEDCTPLAERFASGKAMVKARDYADAMKRAKHLVFDYERELGRRLH